VEPAATHSFLAQARGCMLWRRREHQGCIHSAGTVISIFFFLQEIPPLHASEISALSVYHFWGMGYIFLLRAVTKAGMHSLFFLHLRIRNFRSGPGHFCAYDMFSCWKWTSNRLEAEGNVQIIRAGKHIGMGQAGMAVRGVGGCGIAWQGLIHVDALIAFVFFHFLS